MRSLCVICLIFAVSLSATTHAKSSTKQPTTNIDKHEQDCTSVASCLNTIAYIMINEFCNGDNKEVISEWQQKYFFPSVKHWLAEKSLDQVLLVIAHPKEPQKYIVGVIFKFEYAEGKELIVPNNMGVFKNTYPITNFIIDQAKKFKGQNNRIQVAVSFRNAPTMLEGWKKINALPQPSKQTSTILNSHLVTGTSSVAANAIAQGVAKTSK